MASGDLRAQVDRLIRIGTALSGEREIGALLEMIVDESRRFTGADAGTLYIVSDDGKRLEWRIVQNDTMGTRIGGAGSGPVDETAFEPVPLVVDGEVNFSNVSAYVANTGRTVNIADVYEAQGFDFTGPRRYDAATGYRSKSMLVAPLRNHENDIIGVLQLLNAREGGAGEVVPFAPEYEALVTALASQAAVGITNMQLIRDLQRLFDAFIQTTATAIDEKSPYTAGHVRRVARLTMLVAEEINRTGTGLWGRVRLTAEELKELQVAAWMHDVGKITTPEYVVDKATKLETIYDRIETVRTRYEVFRRDAQIAALEAKLAVASAGTADADRLAEIDARLAREVEALEAERAFVERCNTGGEFMAEADMERVRKVALRTYRMAGAERPGLTEDEVENLCIRKGTLTEAERRVINNHAAVGLKMLTQLPFSKKLKRVPEYAGDHHEKLNGSGYPRGLPADRLPLQARILAVADVFEALTAPDRPYRKPLPLSRALGIIRAMVRDGELDGKIVDLLVESGLAVEYAKRELCRDAVYLEGVCH